MGMQIDLLNIGASNQINKQTVDVHNDGNEFFNTLNMVMNSTEKTHFDKEECNAQEIVDDTEDAIVLSDEDVIRNHDLANKTQELISYLESIAGEYSNVQEFFEKIIEEVVDVPDFEDLDSDDVACLVADTMFKMSAFLMDTQRGGETNLQNVNSEEGFIQNIDINDVGTTLDGAVKDDELSSSLVDKLSKLMPNDDADINIKDLMEKYLSKNLSKNTQSSEAEMGQKEENFGQLSNLKLSSMNTVSQGGFVKEPNLTNHQIHPVAKQVLDYIQSQFSPVNLDSKTYEIRLKLYPSKLGSIIVSLEKDLGGVRVLMSSENSEVRSILMKSASELQAELAKDFANGSVDVNVSSNDKEFFTSDKNLKENQNSNLQEDFVTEEYIYRGNALLNSKILDTII